MQQQGAGTVILLGEETTFKTLTSAAIVLPIASESIRQSRSLVESKLLSGNRNPRVPMRGNYEIGGDIVTELAPQKAICVLLKHTLGSVATSGTESPYTHTFKVGALPVGLSVEKQFADLAVAKYFQYTGCRINSLKLSVTPAGGAVQATFGVLGCVETVAASTCDATAEATVLTPFDSFSAVITEGGASIATVTEFDLEINNNLDGSVYVIGGSGARVSIPAGNAVVKGNIKALFEDVALYTKATGHTESALNIVLSLGTGAGTASNEKITIAIDELRYSPNSPAIDGPNGLLVDLPFVAYLGDDADASALRIEVMNAVASLAIS